MAQENGNRDAQNRIVRGPYETNRFFDNIFIGAAGGVNIYEGENDSYGSFGKRLSTALDIYVGKWVTPSVGLRLGYSGVNAAGWTAGKTLYAKELVDGNIYREKFGVTYLHADVMYNISNAISGYKETRRWNFIPFVGFGYARSSGNGSHNNELGVSIGLYNTVRLCDLLDLTLEARQLFVNERFDGVACGSRGEGMTSLTVGVSFKLNRRGFNRSKPIVPDYTPYVEQIRVLERTASTLTEDNNALKESNAALTQENEELRNRLPEIVEKTKTLHSSSVTPVALFFKLGKATLDKKELANLDFYVNNAIKVSDQSKVFTLTGMADSATGSAAVNKRLSEQRMQYVYDLLVKKYGIAPERLVKKAEGDTNNRFDDPELNRAVIIE